MNPWILGIFNPSNGIILLLSEISSSKGKKLVTGFEKMAPLNMSKITVAKIRIIQKQFTQGEDTFGTYNGVKWQFCR